MPKKYQFLIIGSGAGGATLARELSKQDKQVLVVEKGVYEKKVGTLKDSFRYFEGSRLLHIPKKSKEGVIIWRTLMAGGSTVVSCGNGVRCLEKELADLGISLEEEFREAEAEMNIAPIDKKLLSEGSKRIMQASNELGYKMELMPKFIDYKKCSKCGQCVLGCARGAKWTALDYLKEAKQNKVEILYDTDIEKVIIKDGKVKGVKGKGPQGEVEIYSDKVIVAAGGLGTPVILEQSGIENSGSGLFIDMLVNTYGLADGFNQIDEPSMALVDHEFYEDKGFILSPFIMSPKKIRLIEMGIRGFFLANSRLVGIMTKTRDDATGQIYSDGTISKPVTENDWKRLKEGSSIAKKILIKAGAAEKSILVSKPQGAHPGGTCAIGKIVDKNLQTEIENLFVCDASVLPIAPGMPPILTIVALAKKLAKTLL